MDLFFYEIKLQVQSTLTAQENVFQHPPVWALEQSFL